MGIKPPDITQPFPTESMIKRGSKMHILKQGEDEWLVWFPAHHAHLVEKMVKFYTCDCVGYKMRGICSHIAAVMISQAPKDKEDLFGS